MRESGILMPVFSLPSDYPIGTIGEPAYKFIEFLKASGQSYWQILPIGHTGFGDSPYQTFSSFAGNPYFIDLQLLAEDGLLNENDLKKEREAKKERIDYGELYINRYKTLRKAYSAFKKNDEYYKFCGENCRWLDNYCLFMTIKDIHCGKGISEWSRLYKAKDASLIGEIQEKYATDIDFYRFLQYEFFSQWNTMHKFASENGIRIIGDIPIYVAADSADVFDCPDIFLLDSDLSPTEISGCPPDSFSADGQLWGNPVYNWEKMKTDNYGWWKNRLSFNLKIFDVLRIDHFRGFEAYYSIPAKSLNAKYGEWKQGPSYKFFDEIKASLGEDLPIIAEDLGFLTDEVRRLLKYTGFKGMKVLQFAFDSREESDYLPHNYEKNCVVYTGTHDNDTLIGWQKSISPADRTKAREYMGLSSKSDLSEPMMNLALASVADICILSMPDILGLDSSARINTPSTLGENWCWRMSSEADLHRAAERLLHKTELYGRKRK